MMDFTFWLAFGILMAFGVFGWCLARYGNTHKNKK